MKINFILIISVLFLLINCSHRNKSNSSKTSEELKQDSLSFELCQIYGSDQGIRHMKLITRSVTGAISLSPYLDSINFFKTLDFVKKHGMPTEKLLGTINYSRDCVGGTINIVLLHTPHLLINNKDYLNVFLNEVNDGRMKMNNLITILDKYYVIRRDEYGNRRLLYGSQFGKPCRKFRRESDSVRSIIGLKPLHDSLFIDCKN